MIRWFYERYEDPAHRLPYDSREGGYQWIHGGPHSASSVLEGEFGDVASNSAISSAVDEIEAEGYDWSPKPDEEDDGIFSINAPLPDISDFYFEDDGGLAVTRSDVAELRREMIQKLDQLEALILAARPLHGGFGHNNPPVSIDELPIDATDLDRSLQIIQSTRAQAELDNPDENQIFRSVSWFRRAAEMVGRWLADRANAVVDSVVGSLIPVSATACLVAYGENLRVAFEGAAAAMVEWIHAASMFF